MDCISTLNENYEGLQDFCMSIRDKIICQLIATYLAFLSKQAFPMTVAEHTHKPYLSIDTPEDWITELGYKIYLKWRTDYQDYEWIAYKKLYDISNAMWTDLKGFQALVCWFVSISYVPTDLVNHLMLENKIISASFIKDSFFRLDNADNWVQPMEFNTYMILQAPYTSSHASSVSSRAPTFSTSCSVFMSSHGHGPPSPSGQSSSPISILSDSGDDDMQLVSKIIPSWGCTSAQKHVFVHDSSPEFDTAKWHHSNVKSEPLQTSSISTSHHGTTLAHQCIKSTVSWLEYPWLWAQISDKIQITLKVLIKKVKVLQDVPPTWTIPHDFKDTTYLLDLGEMVELPICHTSGEVMTMDAYICDIVSVLWVLFFFVNG